MKGSIRQRFPGSWELTVDQGRDALGKRCRKLLTDVPEIYYSTAPPVRTDDGHGAAPALRLKVQTPEPPGPRMSHAEMKAVLIQNKTASNAAAASAPSTTSATSSSTTTPPAPTAASTTSPTASSSAAPATTPSPTPSPASAASTSKTAGWPRS